MSDLHEALQDAIRQCNGCCGSGAIRVLIGTKDHRAIYDDRPCPKCSSWRAALAAPVSTAGWQHEALAAIDRVMGRCRVWSLKNPHEMIGALLDDIRAEIKATAPALPSPPQEPTD